MHAIRVLTSLLGVAGCGGASASFVTHAAAPTVARQVAIPRPVFDVVPAELGDHHVLDRIHARALIKNWCVMFLVPGGELIASDFDCERDARDVVPVLDAKKGDLRIVVEDDATRLAVWILRLQARPTVLVPTTIGTSRLGVTYLPGAAITVEAHIGDSRSIAFSDTTLNIPAAVVPADHVGDVWVAREDVEAPSTLPLGNARTVELEPGALIQRAPDLQADTLASTTDSAIAIVHAERQGWLEIELRHARVRVRGFVDARETTPSEGYGFGRSGRGHGVGASHAVSHQVPAGTCLYADANGEVIGVTLEPQARLGRPEHEGWARVYVATRWRTLELAIKNQSTDPAVPQWESCAMP
jgi:hypothetical protein